MRLGGDSYQMIEATSTIPSINTRTSLKEAFGVIFPNSNKVSKSTLNKTKADFGVVNYINGVPVSIELPSQFAIIPTWKQNMKKRN